MRKLILGLAALTMVAAACQPGAGEPEATFGATLTCPWDQSDPTLRTFIVAGQSNMVAANGNLGTLPTAYEDGSNSQLQMWDEGEWKPLALSTENKKDKLKYGPDLPFAWTLHAACPDSNIGIIKYAAGGTSIDTWVPGAIYANELAANISAAYQAHPDITFEGFLYKQGGGDMGTRERAESWLDDYVSIVDQVRAVPVIDDDLPFIHATPRTGDAPDSASGIDPDSMPSPDPSRPFAIHVIVAQWEAQFARDNVHVVIERDIEVSADDIHHTPDGIREVGRLFAETYVNEAS